MSEAKQTIFLATDEILRGWEAIAAVAGVESASAFWRLVDRGLPVTKVGQRVATTRAAVVQWVKLDAERRGAARSAELEAERATA
jgi:hypothetical protein